jgi:hypothetical protein
VRRAALVATALLWVGCATPPPGPEPVVPAPVPTAPPSAIGPSQPGKPSQLFLVSVAGLTARQVADGGLPTLAAMASSGVSAEAVEPVAPAQAYPAHATLVTGVDPPIHGISSERLLGERGVRAARNQHASRLRAPTLWQGVAERGGAAAAFDWPTTEGAPIAHLLPDVAPVRAGEMWHVLASAGATDWVRGSLSGAPEAGRFGPGRDALVVDLACAVTARTPRPQLVLLRLSQSAPALMTAGPDSPEASAAFARTDAELGRLLRCLASAGVRDSAAVIVVGDASPVAIHTALQPNVALADAGLIERQGTSVRGWHAIARTNGGSSFVYARDAEAAVAARRALEVQATETGAFRIVSAEEMIARGADPEAWFGLEAVPGFAFGDATVGPVVTTTRARAAAGYLSPDAAEPPAFVAWGRGLRAGLRVPVLAQRDVAPTAALLLGVSLPGAEGRGMIGLLDGTGSVSARPRGPATLPR